MGNDEGQEEFANLNSKPAKMSLRRWRGSGQASRGGAFQVERTAGAKARAGRAPQVQQGGRRGQSREEEQELEQMNRGERMC